MQPRALGALLTLLLTCLLTTACGSKLKVTKINSAADKPSNVWVFFTVERGDEPVGGLAASDFQIYEDGAPVSTFESKQVILNPQVAAVMYTLLLVDVSGSITESGKIDEVVDAVELFIERVGKTQKVGVYAFDGEQKLHEMVPFTETKGSLESGLERLRKHEPKDTSTNLHGAVVQGLQKLDEELEKDDRSLKFGTLVVFSDGVDRAGHTSREEMNEELKAEKYEQFDLFAIGIGTEEELEQARLEEIGRDGTEEGHDRSKVKEAFEKIAGKIEAHSKRFYLLSYCTPARNGTHKVEIRVETKDPAGKGSLEYDFDATGFGPKCDPERKPSFKLSPEEGGPEAEIVEAGGGT